MSPKKGKSFLSIIASGLLFIFNSKKIKPTNEDLKKAEFKTSTQCLGIRFNEKMRNVFRFKWIRKKD